MLNSLTFYASFFGRRRRSPCLRPATHPLAPSHPAASAVETKSPSPQMPHPARRRDE